MFGVTFGNCLYSPFLNASLRAVLSTIYHCRSLKSLIPALPKTRGQAMISVNEWLAFHNVRSNHVTVSGGEEVILKVKPVKNMATGSFAKMDKKDRGCKFQREHNVRE